MQLAKTFHCCSRFSHWFHVVVEFRGAGCFEFHAADGAQPMLGHVCCYHISFCQGACSLLSPVLQTLLYLHSCKHLLQNYSHVYYDLKKKKKVAVTYCGLKIL